MREIYIVCIAVGVVMFILNLFMFFAIRSISAVVGNQIKKDTYRIFASYDEILEEKSRELERIESRIQGQSISETTVSILQDGKTSTPIVARAKRKKYNPEYLNENFAVEYHSVAKTFAISPEKVITNIGRMKDDSRGKLAESVLEKISYDTVYEMLALSKESQWELLQDILEVEEKEFVLTLAPSSENFDLLELYNELKMQKKYNNETLFVKTSRMNKNFEELPEDLEITLDTKLCKGVQVISGDKMYDFSIGERDIG
ncbi:MAG: hypothetical protein R3Y58_10640 [Eubacteriales bacterium]